MGFLVHLEAQSLVAKDRRGGAPSSLHSRILPIVSYSSVPGLPQSSRGYSEHNILQLGLLLLPHLVSEGGIVLSLRPHCPIGLCLPQGRGHKC